MDDKFWIWWRCPSSGKDNDEYKNIAGKSKQKVMLETKAWSQTFWTKYMIISLPPNTCVETETETMVSNNTETEDENSDD